VHPALARRECPDSPSHVRYPGSGRFEDTLGQLGMANAISCALIDLNELKTFDAST
jgi:hypothetical protein